MNVKTIVIGSLILIGGIFGVYKFAFASSCCASSSGATSGCTPSSCRGAKTKFGEARVISNLRLDLIALKAEMEKSKSPLFNKRSYDIHGIIGDSDEESLEIIVGEVKIIEEAFVESLNYDTEPFTLPENKAKQIQYLNARIEKLQELL